MRLAILAAVLLTATPALALDAIAYKGTLGKSAIIVELTDPAETMMVGRYSYMRVGGDIPLHNLDGVDSFELAEEAPCSEATCVADADNTIVDPPIGGHWSLNFAADGTSLVGSWAPAGKPGKSLPVELVEIGRRTLPDDTDASPMGLADSAFIRIYAYDEPVTAATQPYEFAKMDVALSEGELQEMDGNSFRFVADPRSLFAFPRVVKLADGSAADAVNAALAARHATINVAAFSCLNGAYAGMVYSPYDISMEGGSLGDFDGENIALGYLSPTVIGWTEAGSTYCGGAHPNNHFNSFVLDVRTGEALAIGKIFRDWTATGKIDDASGEPIDQAAALEDPKAYFWSAGQDTIDFVLANYAPDDLVHADDCGITDLIATNLGVRFGPGDTAIFMLEDLPYVIQACADDLLTVNLADLPQLLAPTASDYFPSLAR